MHHIDLTGIGFIPVGRHHFKFLKSKGLIETVRRVIVLITTHFHSLDLEEFIPLLRCGLSGLMDQSFPYPVTVIFFQDAHNGQLYRRLTGLLQAKKARRPTLDKGREKRPARAVLDVTFPRFRHFEPLLQSLQHDAGDP